MKKIFSVTFISLFVCTIFFSFVLFWADSSLTCIPAPTPPQTYTELFNQGNRYAETADIRGFFTLYQVESIKTKECLQFALRSYTQALAIEPTSIEVYNNRAVVYTILGQYQQALTDYQTILRLHPTHDHALIGIAIIYEKSGQLPLAIATYEKVIIQMEQSEYWKQLHPERVLEYREKLAELREQAAEATP